MTEAKCIIQRLNRMTRDLSYRGYGIAQLVFSEWFFVSATDWAPDPIKEVETLLQLVSDRCASSLRCEIAGANHLPNRGRAATRRPASNSALRRIHVINTGYDRV